MNIDLAYVLPVKNCIFISVKYCLPKAIFMKLSQAIAYAAQNEHFLKFLELQNLKAEEAHSLSAKVLKADDDNLWINIMADYGTPGVNAKDISVKVHYSKKTQSFTFDQVARH